MINCKDYMKLYMRKYRRNKKNKACNFNNLQSMFVKDSISKGGRNRVRP